MNGGKLTYRLPTGEEDSYESIRENYHPSKSPTANLVICYQKDNYLHSLNSVQEDIEAEAAEAEEENTKYHSLDYLSIGHSSLSSSVVSSVSLEDGYQINEFQNRCPFKPNVGDSNERMDKIVENEGIFSKNSLQRKNIVNCSTPKYTEANGRSPSDVRKKNGVPCIKNATPNSSGSKLSLKINLANDKCKNPMWNAPSKTFKGNIDKETNTSSLGPTLRSITRNRSKVEVKDSSNLSDSKFSSLPRRKRDKTEKDIVAETYGTLGKNRKTPKEVAVSTPRNRITDLNSHALSHDNKNTLDKYATLPRRRAREMSAKWREQMAANENKDNISSSLHRSKSTGKSDSARGSPSPSVLSPRPLGSTKQPALSRINDRTKNLSPSARLLARQNSSGKDRGDKSPSPTIYLSNKQPRLSRIIKRKHVSTQVNIKWDPDENELNDQLRKLTEEMFSLQQRLTRAESNSEEVEQLRMEADNLRRLAESERIEKEELQEELDKTGTKVKDMLTSMEGVEREFNCRGDSLIDLETRLHSSSDINIRMQEKINQYEEYTIKLHKDMEKSMAAQKTLLQQVQDLEAEGREMADFMAEEKNALSECLKEVECELSRTRQDRDHLLSKLRQKDEEARHMVRLAEERRREISSIQAEVLSLRMKNHDLMVCQGAEVSGTAVGIAHLIVRLKTITGRLIQDYSISEEDIQNVVTPSSSSNSLSSHSSNSALSPVKSPRKSPFGSIRGSPRPVSFMQSFLNAMRQAGEASRKLTIDMGAKAVEGGRKSPDGSEHSSYSENIPGDSSTISDHSPLSPTLADQVVEADSLLTRLLKVCCILKSDADLILNQLEEENERLCSQMNLQQHMIESNFNEFNSIEAFQCNARKELTIIDKELENARLLLSKACHVLEKEDSQNVGDLMGVDRALLRVHDLHTERARRLNGLASHTKSLDNSSFSVNFCNHRENKESTFNDTATESLLEKENDEMEALVSHVLKSLESIPDVVSSCPPLKELYVTLSDELPRFDSNREENFHSDSVLPEMKNLKIGEDIQRSLKDSDTGRFEIEFEGQIEPRRSLTPVASYENNFENELEANLEGNLSVSEFSPIPSMDLNANPSDDNTMWNSTSNGDCLIDGVITNGAESNLRKSKSDDSSYASNKNENFLNGFSSNNYPLGSEAIVNNGVLAHSLDANRLIPLLLHETPL